MYRFFRSLLFQLDPEIAHQLTLQSLRFAGNFSLSRWFLTRLYRAPSKPVQAFGLTFKNPIGLGAGYDKDAVAVKGLSALGFGHVEVGTVTPKPQRGNPRPRVFRLPEDEAVINRMGFPSKGANIVATSLRGVAPKALQGGDLLLNRETPALDTNPRLVSGTNFPLHRMIIGVNLGKNKDTPNEEAVLDYLALVRCFAPDADYLTINVSSPNTVGLRELQGRAALEGLLSQLHLQRETEEKRLQKRVPLLVKLAPDLSEGELNDAIDVILSTQMDGLILTNTTLAREGLRSRYGNESGGLSGSPLRARSEAVLREAVEVVNGRVPITSVGGIMSPEDAKRRLDLGATLIQVYTGLIYDGPGLVKKILVKQ